MCINLGTQDENQHAPRMTANDSKSFDISLKKKSKQMGGDTDNLLSVTSHVTYHPNNLETYDIIYKKIPVIN